VLEALFLASDRLQHDPLDADGLRDLVTAMDDADPARPPYGVDRIVWRKAMALADELVDAETAALDTTEEEGLVVDGEIVTGAAEIAELARELEAQEPDDDAPVEPDRARAAASELRGLLRPFV
jgi:hypothetical protein